MAPTSSSNPSTTASFKAQHRAGDKAPVQYVSLAQVTYNSPPPPSAPRQPLKFNYTELPNSQPRAANNPPQKDRLTKANESYADDLGPSGIVGIDGTGRKSPDGQKSSDLGQCQTGPTCGTCGSALSFAEIGGFCQSCGYAT